MKRFFLILLGMFMSATMLTGCGYNEIQTLDESTKAAWSEVLNQYQRRNDLIPNVVNSVKGEADFEKSTLTQVINARAKATSIQATPELMENPEAYNLLGISYEKEGDRIKASKFYRVAYYMDQTFKAASDNLDRVCGFWYKGAGNIAWGLKSEEVKKR